MKRRVYILSIFLVFTLLFGCAINPVTGKKELHLISETTEIKIGEENYFSTQQSQGGEYIIDPELSVYVNSIGQSIARVSDRPNLPYEFVVLNNSVPNAWAMPGGKIAVNRGLLWELKSEAELAAVLSHEIVHVAARHGAKTMERGFLLKTSMVGVGLAASNSKYSDMLIGASSVGVTLISKKYGRSAELESDYYGMRYMSLAGYNPKAAIGLQKTFVRLSKDKESNWLTGLFSTHPPSQERVEANVITASKLPADGRIGAERYRSKISGINKTKEAYEAHDNGRKALAKGDFLKALSLASDAIQIEPREALFYGLKGDAKVHQQYYQEAFVEYTEAIKRNSRFFQFYLQRGLVSEKLGELNGAQSDLQKSVALFPTVYAHYSLGNIALTRQQENEAIEHFRIAASSGSEVGKNALVSLAKLELSKRPDKYFAIRKSRDKNGYVILTISNRSPLNANNLAIDITLYSKEGRALKKETTFYRNTISSGKQSVIFTTIGPLQADEHLRYVKAKVISAMIAK